MKVSDLVVYQWGTTHKPKHTNLIGTILDFPVPIHSKEFQKVKVLTQTGLIENWVMQFCKVISESR